jgi:hypothetical protein
MKAARNIQVMKNAKKAATDKKKELLTRQKKAMTNKIDENKDKISEEVRINI